MSSRLALASIVVLALGCSTPPPEKPAPAAKPERARPVVVIETDYGTRDDAVALLRGVILSIARDVQLVDLTNEIPPFDIETGAQDLEDAPGIFPAGSVFVVVVDPGVGTSRKSIAVQLKNGSFLVGPDNGVLSLAMEKYGVQGVREITNPDFQRKHESETFHGRDQFAPCGAHLARGDSFADVGPELKEWVKLPHAAPVAAGEALEAVVAKIDEPYGNLWTNVTAENATKLGLAFGQKLAFKFADKSVAAPLAKTFGDVKEGEPLAYWNSRGRLSLAINMGDAAKTYGVKRGDKVTISREK
jgi:S-adenosylmethionine hydrolase